MCASQVRLELIALWQHRCRIISGRPVTIMERNRGYTLFSHRSCLALLSRSITCCNRGPVLQCL
jgi:hypothetical protein